MKKTLFILVFLLSFFLTISYCYASDDILQDNLFPEDQKLQDDSKDYVNEKNEKVKEDDLPEDLKAILYHNEPYVTRAVVNDPLNAKCLALRIYESILYQGTVYPNDFYIYANLTNLSIGDKYILHLTRYNSNNQNYDTFISPHGSDYFIRGYEVKNSSLTFNPNPDTYNGYDIDFGENSYLYTFYDTLVNNSYYLEVVDYVEPEPTPEPTPEPEQDSDQTVSWNSVSDNLISIENQIIDLRKDLNSFQDMYVSNNAVVSNNIIKKRLSDYTVSESIGIIGLLMAVCVGLFYLIHKTIFKWE